MKKCYHFMDVLASDYETIGTASIPSASITHYRDVLRHMESTAQILEPFARMKTG